jgi:hypothetical protein
VTLVVFIILMTIYFEVLEIYEFIEEPVLYINNSQNYFDLLTYFLTLTSVSYYLRNIVRCHEEDCESGIPGKYSCLFHIYA